VSAETGPDRGDGPVWEAILHRRAIRRFTDRALDDADLHRILAAGRRSGSSKNQQRWDFIVSVMFDLGMAAANMQLAAWELGIGSCPATVYDHALAARLLGLPDDRHCEFLLSFGYPADPAQLTAPLRTGGRRPLDDIVHEERW